MIGLNITKLLGKFLPYYVNSCYHDIPFSLRIHYLLGTLFALLNNIYFFFLFILSDGEVSTKNCSSLMHSNLRVCYFQIQNTKCYANALQILIKTDDDMTLKTRPIGKKYFC